MSNQNKRCIKCNEFKSISEFYKDKRKIDGIDNRCKICLTKSRRKSNQKYYQKNKEKRFLYCKEWKKNNQDKVKEARKRYCEKYPEKIKEQHKKYRNNHLEELREKNKEYKKKNRGTINWRKRLQQKEKMKKEQRKELIKQIFKNRIKKGW